MLTTYIVSLSLSVSHLALLGGYIFLYHRRSTLGILSTSLIVTLISGLVGEGLNFVVNSESPTPLIYVTMAINRIGNIAMVLTWLLAMKLFNDSFVIRKVHKGIWLLAASSLIMRSFGSYYAHYEIGLNVLAYLVTWGYSQLVLLGFTLAALYVAVQGFRSDLVIERRQERVIFVICVAVLLLLMAGNRGFWVFGAITESMFRTDVPLPSALYSIYAYCVLVGLFLWKFRVVNFSALGDPAETSSQKMNDDQLEREKQLSSEITAVMEEKKLYRESKLTIPILAKHLESQEYLVRRAINNHLGYRNFSEFLNDYRINETVQLLTKTDKPITNIGISVGYASLSSFYTAFKSRHGMTPKKYRAQHDI